MHGTTSEADAHSDTGRLEQLEQRFWLSITLKLPLMQPPMSPKGKYQSNAYMQRYTPEQEAMSKYQKALTLENNGRWSKAEHVLKELLKSEILSQAKGKMSGGPNGNSAMIHLRYCVTMNLGDCLAKQDKLKKSLSYYVKASKLDSTDLNLWYKMGLTALKHPDLYLASNAFEEGLRCSPSHWPCIDNLVTVNYALGDFLSCLYYAHKGITMDGGFIKGYAFKEKIFTDVESFKEDFALYYPKCDPCNGATGRWDLQSKDHSPMCSDQWRPRSSPPTTT
ncbi:hypothetical protein GE061_018121, partial [Apolygus lucorum]